MKRTDTDSYDIICLTFVYMCISTGWMLNIPCKEEHSIFLPQCQSWIPKCLPHSTTGCLLRLHAIIQLEASEKPSWLVGSSCTVIFIYLCCDHYLFFIV